MPAYEITDGIEHRTHRLEREAQLGSAAAAPERNTAKVGSDLDRLQRQVVGGDPRVRHGDFGGHVLIVGARNRLR